MEEVQTAKRKQDDNLGNAKKSTRNSKDEENPSNNSINRMDEAFLRFPHLPEQFFEELDFKSLANARLVARSWKQFIDAREHRLYPFNKDEIADLKKKMLAWFNSFSFGLPEWSSRYSRDHHEELC